MISHSAAATDDRLNVGGDELAFRVTGADSADALVAFDVRMPAGGGPPVLHRHDPFELYRVEQGEFTFYLEDERGTVRRAVAGPGEVVAIPSRREHTIRNESDAEASAFVVMAPGAELERFAREVGEREAAGPLQLEDILALAAAHGIEITRPLEALTAP